jgi:putative transposase
MAAARRLLSIFLYAVIVVPCRRTRTEGGTYFFMIVTHNRRQFLCVSDDVSRMREAHMPGQKRRIGAGRGGE